MDAFDVYLSGGLRTKVQDGMEYDLEGMYGPFGVAQDRLLSIEQIQDMDFDVLFASNTKMIMPRSVRERVQIFHGISFRNKSVRKANASADFYFIVGPYMKRAFANAGIMPNDDPRALEMGLSRQTACWTEPWTDTKRSRHMALTVTGRSCSTPPLARNTTRSKRWASKSSNDS